MLTSRLIDRPLRPMFAPGWSNDTQVRTLPYDFPATDCCSAQAYQPVARQALLRYGTLLVRAW